MLIGPDMGLWAASIRLFILDANRSKAFTVARFFVPQWIVHMFPKLFSTLALAALSAAGSAQATPWTFTMTGTVDAGYRHVGQTNENLAGKDYTLSIVVDPALYDLYVVGPTVSSGTGYNNNPTTIIFESGGMTTTYLVTTATLSGGVSYAKSFFNNYEETYQTVSGKTASGSSIYASASFLSKVDTGLTSSFAQNYSKSINNANGFSGTSLDVSSDANVSIFSMYDYTPTTLTINGVAAAVPEPATNALLLAGLGLIGAAARRRSRN